MKSTNLLLQMNSNTTVSKMYMHLKLIINFIPESVNN